MRNSYWMVVTLLVLECFVLLIQPSECFLSFIPISVHTALQVLTWIVKIKSVIFKVLLGLKLMGVEGFIMKRRRRSVQGFAQEEEISKDVHSKSYLDWKLGSLPDLQRTELLHAWDRLEEILGEKVRFQEDVCIEAMHKFGVKPVALWAEGEFLNDPEHEGSHTLSKGSSNDFNGMEKGPDSEKTSKWNVSYWISTVLGSALGNPYACHILEKQLNYSGEELLSTNLNEKENSTIVPPTSSISNKNPVVSNLKSNAAFS